MPPLTKILHYIFPFSVFAIAFLLPAFPRTTGFFIGLLIIAWVADGGLPSKLKSISRQPLALCFIALYFAYLLWMIPTANTTEGIHSLVQKLSLLIFPIIFFAPGNLKLPAAYTVIQFFILGCLLACIILLSIATHSFISKGENNFTYTELTGPLSIHPAFISMYLLFGIFCLLLPFLNQKKDHVFGKAHVSWPLILFFIVMIFLLSARQEMIALLLLMPASLLFYFFGRKQWIAGMGISVTLIAGLLLILFLVPEAKMRFEKMQSQVEEPYTNDAPNSVTMRKVIWQSASEIIRQHPLGVGTGDVNDALKAKYKEKNLLWPLNDKLNAHNQYLQTAVALGIPGLLVLIVSLVSGLWSAIVSRNYPYTLFLVLFLFCIITECMLETEAGVVFFAFFNSLLISADNSRDSQAGQFNY